MRFNGLAGKGEKSVCLHSGLAALFLKTIFFISNPLHSFTFLIHFSVTQPSEQILRLELGCGFH